jgi:hypothetical protein
MRCTSCERITNERIVTTPPSVCTTDADVSSQEVSIPRR